MKRIRCFIFLLVEGFHPRSDRVRHPKIEMRPRSYLCISLSDSTYDAHNPRFAVRLSIYELRHFSITSMSFPNPWGPRVQHVPVLSSIHRHHRTFIPGDSCFSFRNLGFPLLAQIKSTVYLSCHLSLFPHDAIFSLFSSSREPVDLRAVPRSPLIIGGRTSDKTHVSLQRAARDRAPQILSDVTVVFVVSRRIITIFGAVPLITVVRVSKSVHAPPSLACQARFNIIHSTIIESRTQDSGPFV